IAVASHDKSLSLRSIPVPLELRDRYATSLESIGRFEDASAELRLMLVHPELSELQAFSVNRRLAETHYRRQDYKNAIEPLLAVLSSQGIHIAQAPSLVRQLPSFFLFALGPYLPGLVKRTPAVHPEREEILHLTISALIECSSMVNWPLALSAVPE